VCLAVALAAAARVIPPPAVAKPGGEAGAECEGLAGVYGDVKDPGVYCAEKTGTALGVLSAGAGGPGCVLSHDDSERLILPGETVELRRGVRGCAVVRGRFGGAEMLALGMKIDINTVSAEDLMPLPGIGPELAARIVSFREKNGPFRSTEEIENVPGIGRVAFERIMGQIVADGGKERDR
jgi:competence protein ComEA